MKLIRSAISALAISAVSILAAENEASLKVGDPAPKLQVSEWVQGEPVKEFQSGKAYIVEFWATWCGPCRVTIPHLNEIHEKYKDKGLIVIGQDVWEKDTAEVRPFVKKMGDKMTYRVALDSPKGTEKGKMAETWMQAAGQNGIPAAFLINKESKIAWIGHPMELESRVIEQVLAGNFDLEREAVTQAERAKNEKQLNSLWRKFSQDLDAKKWESAEAALKEMEAALPADKRLGVEMGRFRLRLAQQDAKGAADLAKRLSDANEQNAMLQNELAWQLVTAEGFKGVDLKTAETIASRANRAAKEKDAAILDTLARVYFLQDKKEEAIKAQQKAVELADGEAKEQLGKSLESYKQGKLPDAE